MTARKKARSRTTPAKAAPAAPAPAKKSLQLIEANSAARALNILGDRWTLMILGFSFMRVRRFEEYQGRIGIARSLLTDRLRRMEESGLLRRERYCEHPPRDEYRLTEMGADLFGASLMIIRWEKRWFYDKRIPAHRIRHSCGKAFTPECRCKSCGELVDPRDTRVEDGPGAGVDAPQKPRVQRRSIVDNPAPDEAMMERSAEVLGDRWTAHVIASAFLGRKRFTEFQSALGVAPNILTDRLTRLVELGVLDQRLYQEKPERWEYRLTNEGDRWLAGKKGPPKIIRHKCGKVLVPIITCDQCGEVVTPDSTKVGPR
jgi:DNA-binding HxlR family transcriptional regulator